MPTYQSRPVFELTPNWIGPRQALTDDVTFDVVAPGSIAVPWAEADQGQDMLTFRYLLTRAELKALEDLQDSVRGRLQGFWLPSWCMDFPLLNGAGSSATTLDIKDVGLADLHTQWPDQYGHLCVFQPDGSLLLKKISGVAAGSSSEVITLTGTLGQAVAANARVSRLYYVRFADQRLSCRYHSPESIEVTIRFLELPREYAAAELGTRPVWLYRVTRGSTEWTWAGYPVAISAASRTWTPAAITHGDLTFDKEFVQGEATLTLATAAANHPFRSYLASPAIEPTHVQIFATEAPGFVVDLTAPFFEADVGAPKYKPRGVIELALTTPVGSGEWPVPRFTRQRLCNHQLYEPGTCRVSPAAFTVSAAITALGSKYIDAPEFGAKATLMGDANWFALGDVSIGSEVRMIVSQSGNRLNLNAPFLAAVIGDVALARRGCDLLRATCKDVFANLVNFGGFPDMPNSDPKLAALEPPKPGGKKG